MLFVRVCTAVFAFTLSLCAAQEFHVGTIAPDLSSITINFNLPEHEVIFQDSIVLSTNTPDITISSWNIDRTPEPYFDRTTSGSRPAYKGSGTITVALKVMHKPHATIQLFFHYLGIQNRAPQERRLTIVLPEQAAEPEQLAPLVTTPPTAPPNGVKAIRTQTAPSCPAPLSEQIYENLHSLVSRVKVWFSFLRTYISDLITHSSSLAIQLPLAFLLGILMSLTPCIYPMIPITVGLLGTSSSNSFSYNFLLAAAYTNGLASVCALLGLLAVACGAQCGQLACNPWVLSGLIMLLTYFGGSMLGWYELYIPNFLQSSPHHTIRRGSLLSAFILGAASGTVASPCMSPGLALLLTIVASLNNYFLGFLLLFVFGVGSSLPLLIIGTFSSSLHILPRTGMWMNEIKKFFGFILIMTCFYYAQTLVTPPIALLGAAIFTLSYSIVYSVYAFSAHTTKSRIYAVCLAALLFSITLFESYTALTMWYTTQQATPLESGHWLYNYNLALQQARQEQKLLLVDFTASWCSFCIMLDKQVLSHPTVQPLFSDLVSVKIDGSSMDAEYEKLRSQYKVLGIPLLLLINPHTEQVIQTWNSALLEKVPQEWVDEVQALIKTHTASLTNS